MLLGKTLRMVYLKWVSCKWEVGENCILVEKPKNTSYTLQLLTSPTKSPFFFGKPMRKI